MILNNRSDIVETTCILVLTLSFIIDKSQDFLQAKSEMFENESSKKLNNVIYIYNHFFSQVKVKFYVLC